MSGMLLARLVTDAPRAGQGKGIVLMLLLLAAGPAVSALAQTDSDQSTLVAADGTAVADDVDTETMTVTLLEADGTTPVPGHNVLLAIAGGGSAGVTISAPSGPSNASGVVTFTTRSSISKVVTFQAIDITNAIVITQTADVNFTPNVTDAGNSTVATDDGTAVANGVETELITVTLLNGLGNPVFDHDVSLAVVAGGSANVTISAPSGPSDTSGVVTFTVSSTEAKTVTFQATDDTNSVTVTQTVDVYFTPNLTDAGTSTVVAADGSAVADGLDTELITVTVLNIASVPMTNRTVSLAVIAGGAANVTISAPSGPSDPNGVVTFTVSSTESKVVTFQATDETDGVVITQTADVNFTPNVTDAGTSTLGTADGSAIADGVDTELVTATLLNAAGNPLVGHDVSLAIVAGGAANVTISAPSGASDSNGVVTFTVSSTESKTVTFQATDDTDGVAITQTADVAFTPNTTDAGDSTVAANDGAAVADGVDTELITVTLLNSLGNPVFDHDVSLAVVAGGAANVTISAPSGQSDASGVVTFTVSSTESKTVTFQATDDTDGVAITQTADVDFTPNVTDAGNSTLAAADGSAVADGVDTELITVTLLNASGNPVFDHDVSLAVIAGGAANVTISAPSGQSDASGIVTFTVSSTEAKVITLQATDDTDSVVVTQTVDVTFTPNVTNAGTSTVAAADGSAVASGTDTELITVTLLNALGNAVPGHDVSLAVVAGGAANVTISAPSGPSDPNGVVTFTVSSTEVKVVTFQATDDTDGVAITQTADVSFTPDQTDAGTSTVAAADGSAVADGTDTELITVTVRNAEGNLLPDRTVSLAVSAGGAANVTISAASGPSDPNGVVTYTVSSTESKVVTFQATDETDGVVITQTADVNFTPNVTDPGTSTVVAADGSAVADGVETELITVTLLNAAGSPLTGHDVSLAVSAGGAANVTIGAPSGPSDASGVVTFAVSATEAKVVTFEATDDTNSVVITQTADVNFTSNVTNADNSTTIAADGSAVADGVETELITVTLLNANGNAVFGHDVSLAVSAGGSANVTIGAASGPSDASGVVTFLVSSAESKVVTFEATDDTDSVTITQTADVDFTPNLTDAGTSTVSAADGTAVADGTETELITVTLLNAEGNAVFGHDVSLAVSAGGSANVTVGSASGASDAGGVVTFAVWATEAKVVTFQATDVTDSVVVTQTADVTFTPGAPDYLDFAAQPADTDLATPIVVSVEILDEFGNRADVTDTVTLTLLDPSACGGVLSGDTTVNAVAGLATFDQTQDLLVAPICDGYRLRASVSGLTPIDSDLFKVGFGRNIVAAAVAVTVADDTTDPTLTYTIEGEAVDSFVIAYGLERNLTNAAPIDTVLGTVAVNDSDLRSVGLHTVALADIRPALNQVVRHGDWFVVQVDVDEEIREVDEDDNLATAVLSVDLVLESLVTDIQGGGSNARVIYNVDSPVDVPDFLIRLGLDTDEDGSIDDVLDDVVASGEWVQPGSQVVTVNLASELLARQIIDGADVRIAALLDADDEVVEADEVENNRRSSVEQGYVELTVALVSTPDEVAVGEELACVWRVGNDGNATSGDVVLTAFVPDETTLVRVERASDAEEISALLLDSMVFVELGTLAPGDETALAIVLESLSSGRLDLWVEVSTDSYTVRGASARVEVLGDEVASEAQTDDSPSNDEIIVEEITTTQRFVGLCGAASAPLLITSMLCMLGLKASLRARRR